MTSERSKRRDFLSLIFISKINQVVFKNYNNNKIQIHEIKKNKETGFFCQTLVELQVLFM